MSVRDAIHTTNPHEWYRSNNSRNARDNSRKELHEWRDRIILRILITSAQKAKTKDFVHAMTTSKNEYFVWIDESETERVFGESFDRLSRAMKESGEAIQKSCNITTQELQKRKREGRMDGEGEK
jgi:hypothetical protein